MHNIKHWLRRGLVVIHKLAHFTEWWQSADFQLCLSCRIHIPSIAWQPAQAITVDTSRGAIDLEPDTEKEYIMWVLGLNAAMTAAQEPQSVQDLPGSEVLWSPNAFVMSN